MYGHIPAHLTRIIPKKVMDFESLTFLDIKKCRMKKKKCAQCSKTCLKKLLSQKKLNFQNTKLFLGEVESQKDLQKTTLFSILNIFITLK